MKKIVGISIVALLILFYSTTMAQAIPEKTIIDGQHAEKGVIHVEYSSASDKNLKLMVEKDGERYFYDIDNGKKESFPLQMGEGRYSIRILENLEGNRYRTVERSFVTVDNLNKNDVYLNSTQNVKWYLNSEPILKAKSLTENLETDAEKVRAIYEYIVGKITYDYEKYANVSLGYVPNINNTFQSNKGICYDYSSLFAAMLRSTEIPTKLSMGYSAHVSEYHAWNEVFIDGKWRVIDTTYDSQVRNYIPINMYKDSNNFKTLKTY